MIGIRQRKYDGDPADLLQEGRTDFAPAVAITLYFDGPRERFAAGVVACWQEFADRWGSQFRWYADQNVTRWRPPTAKMLRNPADRIASRKAMTFYAWHVTAAESYEHASPITFSAIVRDGAGKSLSYLRATFPATESANELLERTNLWCGRIPIRHGYAGLTVNQAAARGEQQMNSGMLPQIAERFPGVEIDSCGGTVLVARDHIKGVNWLTLLGREFVERLGGLSALRKSFSDAIALHAVRDGAVIVQAGPAPSREDVSHYREVARVLRPICLDSHPDLGTAEFGSFDAEGTRRWLRRFD